VKEYSLKVRSRVVKPGMYEVEGVIIYAKTHAIALEKWCRTQKGSRDAVKKI